MDLAAKREWERAVLFGLVEPPPRRDLLRAGITRLSLLIAAALLTMFGAPMTAALAATFTVTSTQDGSGPGTLRNAIIASNNTPQSSRAPNTINIELAVGTPDTITLSSPLPAVQYPVVLNGNGTSVADTFQHPGGDVLELARGTDGGSRHSTITGILLTGSLDGTGLAVLSGGNRITGDTFTHNADGLDLLGGAENNTIGGTGRADGNTIIRNSAYGVRLNGVTVADSVSHNLVEGNFIGTDSSGDGGLGNGTGVGILSKATGNNTIGGTTPGARNVISGNAGDGVLLARGTSGDLVQGNYIGTDPAGMRALGNANGVVLRGGAGNDTIGAADTFRHPGNVISGNRGDGVLLGGGTTTGNVIGGNLIGTTPRGLAGNLLRNRSGGVRFAGGAGGNLINGGVIVSGNDTFTVDLGHAANRLRRASMVGGPGGLIIGGQSIALSAGSPKPTSGGVSYPVKVSAAPANSRVRVNLMRASCRGRVATLRFVSDAEVAVNGDGKGSGTVSTPSALAKPVFLADGRRGADNLSDPCTGTAPPPNPH